MISVEDAKNIILESTNKLKSENVDLIDSLDRISFEDILKYINDEWVEQNIYTDDDSIHLFKEKLQIYRKKLNIKNF